MKKQLPLENIDPLALFVGLQSSGIESFFLETTQENSSALASTIIGIGAFEQIRSVGDKTEILYSQKKELLDIPFFSYLQRRLAEMQLPAQEGFRFQNGGIFGCIGYDCIPQLEPKLKNSGNFASPDAATSAHVLMARKLIAFDHQAKLIHLIAASPFDNEQEIQRMETLLASATKPAYERPQSQHKELEATRLSPLMGKAIFAKKVSQLKQNIRDGEIFQAVLSEQFCCHTQAKGIDIFQSLRAASPAPFSFFFNFGKSTYFGASPESLVKVRERAISTNPIAGTRPRGNSKKEDSLFERQLTRSSKEAAEHLMLVDLSRNDLGRVAAPGTVKVKSFRKLRHFSHVMHLVSEVEAIIPETISALDSLKACFPAGTLSGAPKFRAMQILSELETKSRGFYGGAVVAFDSAGGLESCIAIRSMEVQGLTASFRAGAGIVADSQADREYAEILSKTKLLRVAIASAERNLGGVL